MYESEAAIRLGDKCQGRADKVRVRRAAKGAKDLLIFNLFLENGQHGVPANQTAVVVGAGSIGVAGPGILNSESIKKALRKG